MINYCLVLLNIMGVVKKIAGLPHLIALFTR